MELYKSIYDAAEAEYIVQKSKFIAHVRPIDSYDEAKEYISFIREQYKDATHNVPALILGANKEMKWSSEDGEPQGTAGQPILRLLERSDLTNAVIVVTRYFGGIKLGTGGLMRAYSHVAQQAIDKAGICIVREGIVISFSVEYSYLTQIEKKSKMGLFNIVKIGYTDKVTLEINADLENRNEIIAFLNNLTSGQLSVVEEHKENLKKVIDSDNMMC